MIELITGFIITAVSIVLGYQLGRGQSVVPPDAKKQLNEIFRRVVPNDEVGAVERPTSRENFYRDNPQAKREDEEMTGILDELTGGQNGR